jgi:2-oxoglutarate ferredoxin oxidoreductase subunit alpha
MSEQDFIFKIAGEAGYGIASAGLIFSKTAQRQGYFVFDFNEYPSLIRGGHNVYGARISSQEIYSPLSGIDILVALNQKAIDQHLGELKDNAAVIFDSETTKKPKVSPKINFFPLPLTRLATESGGQEVMRNNVALGAATFLLQADFSVFEKVIRDVFSSAKPEIVDLNIKVALAGFEFAQKNFKKPLQKISLKKRKNNKLLFLAGNDALALGAVKAGCKFFSAYPMTPINSLLAYLAARAKELGLVYFQPEDEIAGINSAIGAAHCGLRSMTATSGGGFSLMVEALGMAGMTETPLVIIEGQRPGPSSGLPTWTSQGDLKFALSASQDDFPRIVLAPGDVEEAFWLMIEAFNLAEKYQTPVIVLVDKYLCESRQTVAIFDESQIRIDRGSWFSPAGPLEDYQRYQITSSGISPRLRAGQPGTSFCVSSYEHDEFGFAREDAKTREKMMEKRMRKLEGLQKELPEPQVFGQKEAKIGLVSWGSNKGAILEAQKILLAEGLKTGFLHLNFLSPFFAEPVERFYQNHEKVLLIEQNFTSQLTGLIREKTGIEIKEKLLKYDGRPFFPEEIVKRVKQLI